MTHTGPTIAGIQLLTKLEKVEFEDEFIKNVLNPTGKTEPNLSGQSKAFPLWILQPLQ